MENNPYSAPESDVNIESSVGTVHPPRRVPTGNGIQWISDGFKLFTQDPGNWIIICIVGFVIMMAFSFMGDLINTVWSLTTAIWTGGLMMGCRAQDEGRSLSINHLFAGFVTRPVPLFLSSLIVFVLSFAIIMMVGAAVAILFTVNIDLDNPLQWFEPETRLYVILAFLIITALTLPIIAMAWFAPPLIVLDDIAFTQAFAMSFKACFKNFLPFLVYSIVLLLIFIVAVLPIGLGLLVAMPIFYGSLYAAYKDIFIE